MDIVYTGEWTWVARLGQLLIATGFAAALLAVFGYLKGSLGDGNEEWKRFGRKAYWVHVVSFFSVIVLIYILIFNHRYEFQYVWKYMNNGMPTSLQFASFWGGQEGGFLLWMFWHLVLSIFIIRKKGVWEGPVMTFFAAVQASLACMLLGVYFGDYQFGLDPFLLTREAPNNLGLPWTKLADYLTRVPMFEDGQGLNPLLQNYWMVIHPPTLFLGFASTVVPFAFALAGLWKKKYIEWMRPATPWAFFGVMILGTGILMGGAWAYEALSFGGFWAWDPVENSSLVPWILLVGGAHLLMVNRTKVTSVFSALFLIVGAHLLIVYSTFLTKSGILGDTSVHSFVDSGILPQLLVYLLAFAGLATIMMIRSTKERWVYIGVFAILFFVGYFGQAVIPTIIYVALLGFLLIKAYRKDIPKPKVEEELWSREFWIFIGSMVLLAAAIHISFQTSLNVFNKLLEPFEGVFTSLYESTEWPMAKSLADHSFAPNTDYKQSYHIVQVPLAFLFIMLIGFVQWLKYKNTDMKKFVKKISRSLIIAAVLMSVLLLFTEFRASDFPVAALVFACIFAFTSNFDYLISIAKGKWDRSGANIAHIGFSLLILGAVISTSQSEIISQNQIGNIQDLNTDLNNREDMLLMQNDTLQMGDYFISYTDRYVDGIHHKFTVQYFENIPRAYEKDDIVYYGGMVFEAKDDHIASRNFIEQMADNWRRIDFPNERHAKEAIRWSSGTKGDSLFTLEPRIQLNEQMGNAPEPDTRHMLHKDVYTHLKWARLSEPETDEEGFLEGRAHDVHAGDSMIVSNILVTFDDIIALPDSEKAANNIFVDDIALQVRMTLKEKGEEKVINPLWIVRDSQIIPDMVDVDDWGMRVLINRFDPTTQTINLTIWEHESIRRDFIVMQAVIFPQINVLWIGCLIMILGTTLAVRHRIRLARQPKLEE